MRRGLPSSAAAIRATLETGIDVAIAPTDMPIAAHARSRAATLVSSAVRRFARVEGLPLESRV